MQRKLLNSLVQERYQYALILLLYSLLVLFGLTIHELWRDEADSWLVAQDMSIKELLLEHTRKIGHPSLWYLILMPFAKLGFSYQAMLGVHGIIALSMTAVFLFYAPLPKRIKTLTCFSIIFIYEFAIISRGYGLGLLLLFSSLALYQKQLKTPKRYACCVALLFNTTVMQLFSAGALALIYFIKIWQQRTFSTNHMTALFIMAFGALASFLQLIPLGETSEEILPWFSINTLSTFYFFLVPFSHTIDLVQTYAGTYQPIIFPIITTLGAIMMSCLLIYTSKGVSQSKNARIFFLLSTTWLFYVLVFNYAGAFRHYFHFIVFTISALWICKKEVPSLVLPKKLTLLLSIILGLSCLGSFSYYHFEYKHDFSASKKTAQYIIKNNYADHTLLAFEHNFATSILPYLRKEMPQKMMWDINLKEFSSYSKFDKEFWNNFQKQENKEVLKKANIKKYFGDQKDLLFITSTPIKEPQQFNLKEIYFVEGLKESFWLYIIASS
jgi:hypothetical protein